MIPEPGVAEDQGGLSKAGDGTLQLLSMLSNFNNYEDKMSDIACLILCAINVQHWNGVFQRLKLYSLLKSPALIYETSGGTTV